MIGDPSSSSATFNNPEALLRNKSPDRLIAILHVWGISYLTGGDFPLNSSEKATDLASAVTLIQGLAQCEYPRMRDACISLFLLHPELAPAVRESLQTSEPATAERIAVLVLATLYLQRLWSIRLTLALGHAPSFPEQQFAHLWRSRHLSPPTCHDGSQGLLALQAAEQRRTGLPLNFIGDWQNQIDHLLLQEEGQHHSTMIPVPQLEAPGKEDEKECSEMSMRPNVDKAQIESFLNNLGRVFRKPGRLYLVGGAALVHLGLRPGYTEDIDVEVAGKDEGEMIAAIRQLVRQMNINIEFASPGHFIPLPSHWMAQSKYIGRYGEIEVFYFDFYSIALSKINRGTTRDINDVKLLVQQKVITLPELDAAYNEVHAQMGQGLYARLDPQRFAERYTSIRQLLV